MGTLLNFLAPAIPFEFACVVAGLGMLVGLIFLVGIFQLCQLMMALRDQISDDEHDDEEPTEFAEQIAEIVSERLEPHYWKQQRRSRRH
jgi:hypothetical protein